MSQLEHDFMAIDQLFNYLESPSLLSLRLISRRKLVLPQATIGKALPRIFC